MRMVEPTIARIISNLPQGPFWRAERASGRPRSLTIAGKCALAILEAHFVTSKKIIEVLGLHMGPEEFAEFRQRPSINDPEIHERFKRREAAIAAGRLPSVDDL